LNPITVRKIATPGSVETHQASRRYERPSATYPIRATSSVLMACPMARRTRTSVMRFTLRPR
jgi:hypothetical protein